jgi:hypothetical protein
MPESKRFLLRLNPGLFEALRRWADEDLRSINAQIEYLLTDSARRAGRLPKQAPRRLPKQAPRRPPPDPLDDELAELDSSTSPGTSGRRR